MTTRLSSCLLVAAAAVFGLSVASAQTAPAAPEWSWPERMKNPKVLPASTPPKELGDLMRRFSGALGVRCTYCHVGEEGKPLSTYDFASDAKPNKDIARDMMRLTFRINTQDLPAIGGLEPHDPGARRVTCFTCHRGSTTPATMRTPPSPAAAPAPGPTPAPAAPTSTERG